jgi:hypothetical protein
MNARERQVFRDAIIGALVKTRDDHNEDDNRELLAGLLRELPRLIDVNNFDQRTKRAKDFKKIVAALADVEMKISDYLLEHK